MNVIIDRFEGDFAVVELENRSYVNISKKVIPEDAGEGTVLSITVNRDETKKLKAGVSKLLEDLNKEKPTGNQRPNSLDDLFKDSNVEIQPGQELDTGAPVGREIW